MSLEADMVAVLRGCCTRVVVGTAPMDTKVPYVTWQHVGGASIRYLDNAAATTRSPEIQINAWAATPMQAFALIQQIEEALCAAPALVTTVHGEPILAYDDADVASGYLQTFTVCGAR